MGGTSDQRKLTGFDDEAAGRTAAERQPQAAWADLKDRAVWVIDAHSLIFQVFHALPEMTSPRGEPVAAIHGFLRDLLYLLETKQPDYLLCAFDRAEATFRHELYEDYKKDREAMPQELQSQIPAIYQLCEALGIPVLDCPGYEADDILATVAAQVEAAGGRCYLVTSDKDCRQLISDRVLLYNIRKDELLDAAALQEQWGVRPEQVVDFQALVGDSTDNVPGVPLIGPKLASQLLGTYGTLEGVLQHADEVSGKKRRENLIQYRDQALLSRRLVELDRNVPIQIDWSAARVGRIDGGRARELCQRFGFRQLARRIAELADGGPERKGTKEGKSDYQTVTTLAELRELVSQLSQQKLIAVDTETTSIHPRWAEIVGYSFAWGEGRACYVPVRAPRGDPQLDAEAACQLLRPVLENEAIAKVGQNLKYDMIVLRAAGVQLRGVRFDTMVAHYLLEPGERNHNLDELARRYLNHKTISISELIGKGKKQKRMDQVPVELVAPYAAEDALVPLRLMPILQQGLQEAGLQSLLDGLEMPLVEVLAEMEYNGIKVDTRRLAELSQRFGRRLAQLEQEIYELAGCTFNIQSPKQLGEILFDQLGLPVVKRTKTSRSTDWSVLSELARQHPLPAKIIEYRQHAKLKNTYVDALPALVHPQTGRIHTSFTQDVAATGRLSSKDPNLQNIPVRTEEGRQIRSAFLPGQPHWRLLTADYSQIELRVLAHFSGDEALRQAFAEDQDIHRSVASQVYQIAPQEVTADMRRSAKAINFGIIYGQSPYGLARSLGIETDEAARFIDAYFAQFPGVDRFIEKVLAECRQKGYVNTVSGRRRAITGVRDPAERGDSRQRNLPERIAINTVIQGSAADLIKQAMVNVYRRLQDEKLQARMLLQIHDELVFEAPADELPQLARLVDEEMTGVGQLDVPLKVDIKTGTNWAECEPWD